MVRLPAFLLLSLPVANAMAQTSQAVPAADLGGSLWQLLFGLLVVLAMLGACLWLLKKLGMQHGGNSGLLRVVAGTSVGARERVVIVEVGTTWLVLGVAPGQVSALAEVPRQAVASPSANQDLASGTPMPEWLRKLAQRR